ncbi:hypothetical protein JIQ42_04513 [Leishmania sp. Namibia]|uniref:hypothetical protein n=1 Tax=Leishmania sp. Namibia TaxID=2802991 RepID=UPI001B3EFDFF|nr:hypothetical protein JIQ42_04513 [Leishmania sp. Namibia]
MSTLEFDEVDSGTELSLSIHTEKVQFGKHPSFAQGGVSANETPRLPRARGPGHTPRENAEEKGLPPRKMPSSFSLRNGTPRQRDDASTQEVKTGLGSSVRNVQAGSKPRASRAQSNRSVQFFVNDDGTDTGSILFHAEGSMRSRNHVESSVDLHTYTDGSDINFVEQSYSASQAVAVARSGAATRSASLRFELESTNEATHHSTISRFSIEGDEWEPKQIAGASDLRIDREGDGAQKAAAVAAKKQKAGRGKSRKKVGRSARPSVDRRDDSARKAASARVVYGKVKPIEHISWSERRRRAERAEAERRTQVLRERRRYMGGRPWETNKPNPRARRTSSESVAYALKQLKEKKKEEADERRRTMNARPWRTNSATPRKSRSVSRSKRRRWSAPPSARSDGASMARWQAAPLATVPEEMQAGNSKDLARLAEDLRSSSSEEHVGAAEPARYGRPRPPLFDRVEATKFVTPAPVLKTPLEVVGEELEDWTYTVNQQRNLQALAQAMRARERTIVQLMNQLETQSRVMTRLDKDLYSARDHYAQKLGRNVAGPALPAPQSAKALQSPGRTMASCPPSVERLYKKEQHQATDYYAMNRSHSQPRPVSVLSDDELSESEKENHASDLQRWRIERAVLRDERARMVRCRRELVYQMRRGSNIKDIAITQPTSARGPLERAAAGTETAVDVDGYDRLRNLRMQTQRALVEASNAKKVYSVTLRMAHTMSERYNPSSAELEGTKDWRNTAREQYVSSLRDLQESVKKALPLLERANALKARREKMINASLDESAAADFHEYSDAVLAARMQTSRAQALVEAAANDEERMLGSAITPQAETSQSGTPRGSSSDSDDAHSRMMSRGFQNAHTTARTPAEVSA